MRDLTNLRFGKLVALKADHKDKCHRWHWLCQCDCGKTTIVSSNSLLRGSTRSCGCLNDEQRKSGNNRRVHGGCGTRLYRIWKQIRTRCNNPNNSDYKRWYGSKGIKVCSEWDNSFEAFRDWSLANGYNDNLTIDRIDSNDDYEPNNCRWVTWREQSRNTSQNVNVSYNGETHCLTDWANILDVDPQVFRSRLYRGWSIERTLTQPVRKIRKRVV